MGDSLVDLLFDAALTTSSRPYWVYSVHTSVVMVKPGGTGMPRRFISARLAPLPPRRLRSDAFAFSFAVAKCIDSFHF